MEFKHVGGEPARLNLEINLDRFRFLQAGDFDRAVKEMEDMAKYTESELPPVITAE